jgi:hypothetical protein
VDKDVANDPAVYPPPDVIKTLFQPRSPPLISTEMRRRRAASTSSKAQPAFDTEVTRSARQMGWHHDHHGS